MKHIILGLLLFTSNLLFSQNTVITGKIISADDNEPAIGCNILIKGTTRGTTTDLEGKFRLEANKSKDILIVTYTGYTMQEVAIANRDYVEIALQASNQVMNEVVVVGYGIQRKSDLTGSVSSVKGQDLAIQPVMTPTQALQGKVAGVQVIASGKPGSSPNVRVRGVGTALAGNAALFVVDGVLTDDISNINNADISSIDILKDASSTAIYGARGANGVVIITTKKGVNGPLKVNYNTTQGMKQASHVVEMANNAEYSNYVSATLGQVYNGGSVSSDWFGSILRNAYMQSHNISFSGGGEKNTFYVNLGYLNDRGIVIDNDFSRITARLNNDYTFNKKVKVGVMASYTTSDEKAVNLGAAYNNAYRAAPVIETVVDGRYGNTSSFHNVGNPILDIKNNYNNPRNRRMQAASYIEIKPLSNLTFKSSLGGDLGNLNQRIYNYQFNNDLTTFLTAGGNQRNPNSNLEQIKSNNFRWVWDNTLTYTKTVGKVHNFTIMGGTTSEEYTFDELKGFRKDVPPDPTLWYINQGNANTSTNDARADKWRRIAYLGRLNYNYDNRYLLTATMRADGSSRFPEANRWGYFPSVGAAWNITNEPFMQDNNLFSYLKLRTSYGVVGNDRIPSDSYVTTVDQGLVYFFNETTILGTAITQVKDPNLKWETTSEFDFGLDFALWKGSLQGEIGYYTKTARDLLINVRVPSTVGDKDGVVLTNAASIKNDGLELVLNWRKSPRKNFEYKVGGNITLNNNKVVGLNGGQPILAGGVGAAQPFTTKSDNDQAVGSFYVLNVLGVFQTDEEVATYTQNGAQIQPTATAGDFKYEDTNKDGKIDDNDRVFAGSYQPKAFFGLNFGATWHSFDFGIDFFGNVGNKIYNGKKAVRLGIYDNIEKSTAFDRWSLGSGINNEPKANSGYLPASTYFVESGDFIRINNVTFGYNLPASKLKKIKLNSGRVYITAQNVYTLTKFTGFTPELVSDEPTSAGIELNAYPTNRVFALGVNIGI